MVYAGIVAGGSGTRMKNAPMPKQFLETGGVPIIIRTVKAFCEVNEVDKIIIGIKADRADYMSELLDKFCIDRERVMTVNGGENRNSTVLNIAAFIKEKFGITKGDIILTHDAVRPFVSERIIRDNIEAVRQYGLCGTYIAAADTVIASQAGTYVDKTLDRRTLYQAQTPQSFELDRLYDELSGLGAEELDALTDTCSVFTRKGDRIRIVKGDRLNFKITTDEDLKLAAAVSGSLFGEQYGQRS
ncbi:MAG: 2-C-methyl-D-erythritol 4-phosphate cytidylyltransferase [Ruminococcus sp.]|nr:2-C-methyl-D-erythritol 4-phosphate cytidylyltransferase [Ruminococcus sp.]